MSNPPTLPEPIAAYFAADRRDSDTITQCFTPDAVVRDEGHTYTGTMAIKQWKRRRRPVTRIPANRSLWSGATA